MSSENDIAASDPYMNVHPLERLVSVGLGACLIRSGLHRKGLGGCLNLLLGSALAYRGVRGHCPLYGAYDINTRAGRRAGEQEDWQEIEASVIIARPPNEVYGLWRDLAQMPQLLSHVEEVEILDDQRSRWTIIGPANASLQLISRIEEDVPDQRISWRSTPQSSVKTRGRVSFEAEGANATRLHVQLAYHPPGGSIGRVIGRIFGPGAQRRLEEDLQRFRDSQSGQEPSAANTDGPVGAE